MLLLPYCPISQFVSQGPSRTPWTVNEERDPMPSIPWIHALCICISAFRTWSLLCISSHPISLINVTHKNSLTPKFNTLKKTVLLVINLRSNSHHERVEFRSFLSLFFFIPEPTERFQGPTVKVETKSISSECCEPELASQTHTPFPTISVAQHTISSFHNNLGPWQKKGS